MIGGMRFAALALGLLIARAAVAGPVPACKDLQKATVRVRPRPDLVGKRRAAVDASIGAAPVCHVGAEVWVYEDWACEFVYQTIVTFRRGKAIAATSGDIRTGEECL